MFQGIANFPHKFGDWADRMAFFCIDLTNSGNSADCEYNSEGFNEPCVMQVEVEFEKELTHTTLLYVLTESSQVLELEPDGTAKVV